MIYLIMHHKITLVITTGNYAAAFRVQRVEISISVRILDPNYPCFAGGLRPGGANIAAHTDQKPRRSILTNLFHGITFRHCAYVQTHGAICKVNGGRFFINDHIVKGSMLGSQKQLIHIRNSRHTAIYRRTAGIMPKRKHTPHSCIHHVIGSRCHLLAEQKQRNDLPLYFDRGFPRIVVDGFQVIDALILVINIVEPVIVQQFVMDLLRNLPEFLFRFRIPDNGCGRVKHIKKSGFVACLL